jgi:hypothetical protein
VGRADPFENEDMTQEIERRQDGGRNWQSVRTILEGLILVGVLWLGNSAVDQGKTAVELQAKLVALTDELRGLSAQLSDIPALSRSMAKIEVKLDEHDRRISRLEGGKG